ncbi:hypothetical protein L596_026652 [Steinernema carpocapsae]|uniref:7TM GPCR serpentine receptor class x (Srx) domain-containing protein n=1 Tax=Steinernema carpocapsae TaxID=34508 RepID=A0A4U5M200_STECR|nr:hypothetical protein L596_026652 [Steinernema carpocapsae]
MSIEDVTVGSCVLVATLIFVPIYVKILYHFIRPPKYRSLECYQLMFQQGIAQCCHAFYYIPYALFLIFEFEFYGFLGVGVRLMGGMIRVETSLGLVLALNRLKIICELRYPKFYHKLLCVLSWLFGFAYIGAFFTPYAGLNFEVKEKGSVFDYSKPLTAVVQEIGYIVLFAVSVITLIIYLFLVIYLMVKKCRFKHVVIDFKERWILMQAVLRFIGDDTLTFMYHLLPHLATITAKYIPYYRLGMSVGYVVNNLVLPTMLYILLNRSLRQEMLVPKRTITVVLQAPSK